MIRILEHYNLVEFILQINVTCVVLIAISVPIVFVRSFSCLFAIQITVFHVVYLRLPFFFGMEVRHEAEIQIYTAILIEIRRRTTYVPNEL